MTDFQRDGELLSAYLSGDLDDAAAAALERRLARDPGLVARLEATHAVVEALARFDEVEPPDGFGERLRARLADERVGVAHAPAAPPSELPSLDAARSRRRDWLRQRWPAVGAVAAGIVGVALLAGLAVVGFGADDRLLVADDPGAEADMEALEAPAMEEAPLDSDDAELLEERVALREPLVLDSQVPLDDAQAVRTRLEGSPAASLLGVPVEEADDIGAAFAVAVQRAEPFASGVAPGACLDTLRAGTEQPVVPAAVEAVTHEGEDALLYVTATARTDADALDRLEAWVVEPADCATRIYVELPG